MKPQKCGNSPKDLGKNGQNEYRLENHLTFLCRLNTEQRQFFRTELKREWTAVFFFGSIILKSTLASVQFYPPNSLSVRGSNSQWCCKGSASCTQKRACASVRHWQNCLSLGCSPQESQQPITSLHLTLLPASTCHPRISCQPFPTSTSFCSHIHRLSLSSEHLTGADPLPSSYPRSSTSEALPRVLSTASLHLRQATR